MIKLLRYYVTLLLFTLSLPSTANNDDWLSVEILIFKQDAVQSVISQEQHPPLIFAELPPGRALITAKQAVNHWLANIFQAYPEQMFHEYRDHSIPYPLEPINNTLTTLPEQFIIEPTAFTENLANTWELQQTAHIFNKKNALLYHNSWLQPQLSGSDAQSVSIQTEQPTEHGLTELAGTVNIRYSRFPHAELDLRFTEPRLSQHQDKSNTLMLDNFFAQSLWQHALPVMLKLPDDSKQTYRLHRSARLSIGKVYYVDHPVFGVLLFVNKHPLIDFTPEELSDVS